MSRSLVSLRLQWQTAGRPGGKGQAPVVPRGFEKRQEVDPGLAASPSPAARQMRTPGSALVNRFKEFQPVAVRVLTVEAAHPGEVLIEQDGSARGAKPT